MQAHERFSWEAERLAQRDGVPDRPRWVKPTREMPARGVSAVPQVERSGTGAVSSSH